jgi:hypothetical protein
MAALHAHQHAMTTHQLRSKQAAACGAARGMAWRIASRRRMHGVKPSAFTPSVLAGNPRRSVGVANGLFAAAF